MATKNVEAIILFRRDFGEADRLITAYSKEEGKIRFIAKGARRLKSKMASHIEPFTLGKYFLAEGKNFYILAGAESNKMPFETLEDLDLFKDASYLAEIIELMTVESQKNEVIYENFAKMLTEITWLESNKREFLIHYFEYLLLKQSGYFPNYTVCKKCNKPLLEQKTYRGNFEGVICDNCPPEGERIDLSILKILRLFEGGSYQKLLKIADPGKYNNELSKVTRAYLYDILPKIPKSIKCYE